MSSTFGTKVKISIFGESHGQCVGAVCDGLPSGFEIDEKDLSLFMSRRAPGGEFATGRKEEDKAEIMSGTYNGKTSDAPLCIMIKNNGADSSPYGETMTVPRPGHADITSYVHSGGFADFRGGGHNSGRLTAPLCAVGGIILQMLEKEYGIKIYARLLSVGSVSDEEIDTCRIGSGTVSLLDNIKNGAFPTISTESARKMKDEIAKVKGRDSLGGIVECIILNVPAGIGEPMFEGIENTVSQAVFAIPGVKGIEFGDGFEAAGKKGSEENDAFILENDSVLTETNNCGGILGGRATGMPIVFRAAFKPTPSIAEKGRSVDIEKLEETEISVKGKHDPCIALRAVPCVEAAAAAALAQYLL